MRIISIVRHFRPSAITWLSTVIYAVPNDDFRSSVVGEHASTPQPYLYSESGVFSLLEALRACVSGTVLCGAVFAEHTEVWNHGLYATVKDIGMFNEIAHHGRETRVTVAVFSSSPFCRDPVRFSQRFDPSSYDCQDYPHD